MPIFTPILAFCLLPLSIADPILLNGIGPEDALERKTAENSLLKGKKDYSEKNGGELAIEGELEPWGPIEGGTTIVNGPDKESGKSENVFPNSSSSISESQPPKDELAPILNGTSIGAASNPQSTNQSPTADVGNGRRLFDVTRVRQCLGWCLATLPPWYSDLAKVNCARKNECEKAPENEEDCGQRCRGIIKDLPIRPVLSCPYFCELAYGGLEKTAQFCKGKCP